MKPLLTFPCFLALLWLRCWGTSSHSKQFCNFMLALLPELHLCRVCQFFSYCPVAICFSSLWTIASAGDTGRPIPADALFCLSSFIGSCGCVSLSCSRSCSNLALPSNQFLFYVKIVPLTRQQSTHFLVNWAFRYFNSFWFKVFDRGLGLEGASLWVTNAANSFWIHIKGFV